MGDTLICSERDDQDSRSGREVNVGTPRRMIHVIGGSEYGGGSVMIAQWARAAIDAGWEVDILASNPRTQAAARAVGAGVVDLDVARRPIRPLRDFVDLIRLYWFFRNNRYNLVQCHTSKGALLGRAAATLARVPVVVATAHGFAFNERSSQLTIRAITLVERLAARWCHRITFVSEFHGRWAAELKIGRQEQHVVIPNGIPDIADSVERPRKEVREDLGVDEDEFLIVAHARLAPQKGLDVLIDALPEAIAISSRPVRAVIAGEGPDRAVLEDTIRRRDLSKSVTLLGFRSDIADLLAAADVIVLPSNWEGLSISLLEALASGRPVITTRIGSNVEVTSDGRAALLVERDDPEALAQAISRLADDDDLASQLQSRARNAYVDRYTDTEMNRKYVELYDQLVPLAGPPRS